MLVDTQAYPSPPVCSQKVDEKTFILLLRRKKQTIKGDREYDKEKKPGLWEPARSLGQIAHLNLIPVKPHSNIFQEAEKGNLLGAEGGKHPGGVCACVRARVHTDSACVSDVDLRGQRISKKGKKGRK